MVMPWGARKDCCSSSNSSFFQWISSIPEYSARIPRVLPRVHLDGLVVLWPCGPYHYSRFIGSRHSTCRQPSPNFPNTTHGRRRRKRVRFPKRLWPGVCIARYTTASKVADYVMTTENRGHHHHDRTRRMHFHKTSHELSHPPSLFRNWSGLPRLSRLPWTPRFQDEHIAWLAKRIRRDGHQMESLLNTSQENA